ncbi:hypothetical protein DI487_07970 [Flavobacterium sediminis]|uniref:Outer membrane protein beta-barrel domain-containing protein n=1 Tax=Flavobacterium sediminis TaxID=2201181 RepID=A0A2U8QV98_9FLAO|nr:porin family protein [Flavobacterium sediminis]AWM13806.1 hypothetical protein DI487_07970 [Flavobacterium sediminis]
MKLRFTFSFLIFFFCCSFITAQETEPKTELKEPYKVIDSLFREDQFYVSITYNLMQNKPAGYKQYSFSTGITLGAMRDMPFTKDRKWSVALGVGYSYNNIKHNIQVQDGDPATYAIENSYDKNKLILHYLDIPLEIRWRNAAPLNHKFWRIYTGFKASYLLGSKSDFQSAVANYKVKNNSDVSKWQLGPYISVGYNTINMYVYYGLTPIFKNTQLDNQDLKLSSFNVGFMFYIL